MDGIETATRIRKVVGRDIPIIILSAYDCPHFEEIAQRAGVDGFISKPLMKSKLFYLMKSFAIKQEEKRKRRRSLNILSVTLRVSGSCWWKIIA